MRLTATDRMREAWGVSWSGLVLAVGLWVATTGHVLKAASADPSTRPLPTVDQVLTGLLEQNALEEEYRQAFAERYAHVRTRVREERNPAGKLRQRTEERFVHDPTRPGDGGESGRAGGRIKQYGERDFPLTKDLIHRFTYEVEGREETEGRWLVRVSFRPSGKDLPQRGLFDRFINRTAGTLWLDEANLVLVRARVALLEEVSFLAGIAGVVHSLNVVWERTATPDGLWYTRRGTWRVDFRQFLVRKIIEFEERREDVRPAATLGDRESG